MTLTLPLRSDLPHYSFDTTLDGVVYGFEFFWNTIEEGWFMSLFSSNGDALLQGLRVTCDWPLAKYYATPGFPPAMLMAQDTGGEQKTPGRDDLGTRVLLLYFSESELST